MFKRCVFLLAALVLGAYVLPPLPAVAGVQNDMALVRHLGDEALKVLVKAHGASHQVAPRFRILLRENFDIHTISRFVLGKYWNQATPDQQKEYTSLMGELIVVTYADRLSAYSGETFEVLSSHPEGKKDRMVLSRIVRPQGGPPVNISWRLRDFGSSPKIIDVVIEGVSMGATQREEFATTIQRTGGIEGLLESIRAKINRQATGSTKK